MFKGFISKNTGKIIRQILLIMSALMIIMTIVLYNNFKDIYIENITAQNKKLVGLLSNDVDYMNEMIKTFCITTYFNSSTVTLMNNDESDFFEYGRAINNLQKIVAGNSIIDSVLVYNNKLNVFYSTIGDTSMDEPYIIELFETQKDIPKLKPIPRILSKDYYYEEKNAFTYFMYDSVDHEGRPNGALIINIKTDWFLQNLVKASGKSELFYIIDEENNLVAAKDVDNALLKKALTDEQKHEIFENNYTTFITGERKNKEIYFCFAIPNTDWILVSCQPYEDFLKNLNILRNNILLLEIGFIFLLAILTVFAAKKIYAPIDKAVRKIRQIDSSNAKEIKNDMDYIVDSVNQYEKEKKSVDKIIKSNYLKEILIAGNTAEELSKSNIISFDGLSYIVGIFKIDDFSSASNKKKLSTSCFDYIVEAVKKNIDCMGSCEEIFKENGRLCMVVPMKNEVDFNTVESGFYNIIENLKQETAISASVFISELCESIAEMTKAYKIVTTLAKYGVFYGYSCILTPFDIKENEEKTEALYFEELEKKIIGSLNSGDYEASIAHYDEFSDLTIKNNNAGNFYYAIMRLAIAMQTAFKQLNFDYNKFNGSILDFDDIKKIKSAFYGLFADIIQSKREKKESKHSIIVNSVKEYIISEYPNPNLSLKIIASEFDMSVVYLGKIFKDEENCSIAEYINDVRLAEAARLLSETNFNNTKIMEKIGYESESSFYNLFKKKHGLTPKEYKVFLYESLE